MKNQTFWGKLSKFVKESNSSSFAEKLTLDDGSIITITTASTLVEEHNHFVSLMEKYDKECDYNRLLRRENFELMDYIGELEESISLLADDDSIENEVNEYLMNINNEESDNYKS